MDFPEDNAPDLTLRRLTAGILYNRVNLDRQALANFYAQASTAFDFTTFNLLPDGGRMAVGEDDLIIQPERTQVNMNMAGVPFEAVRQRAVAQFDAVRQFLRVPQWQAFGVKIVGNYPLGEASPAYLQNRLIRPEAELDRLGSGLVGTGFRFNLQNDATGIWDIRLEPLFSDVSHIYIDIDAQKTQPFSDLSEADDWLEKVERYCRREVVDFIQNLPA
jgi:hypothetical protein